MRSRALVMALCVVFGCEGGSLQLDRSAQPPPLAPSAARVMISAQGIAQLARRQTGGQLDTTSEARVVELPEVGAAQLGPLAQQLSLGAVTATTSADEAQLSMALGSPALLIPMRLGQGAQTRICRWRVALTSASVSVRATLVMSPELSLSPLATPLVGWSGQQVTPVGACELPAAAQATLRDALLDYSRDALRAGANRAASVSPAEELGVGLGVLELTRGSAFESRRGQLLIGAELSSARPASLSQDGLSLDLDVGTLTRAAPCGPPQDMTQRAPQEAVLLLGQELRQRRADAAIVLTLPLIERLARGLARAGFSCRGVEDMAAPELAQTGALRRRDARLEDVGIETSLMGDHVAAVWSLSAPPRVELVPQEQLLLVSLPGATLELYAMVAGALTRVAVVSADVALRLRPTARGTSALVLAVDDVTTSAPKLDSAWRSGANDEAAVQTWTRRLFLLIVGEELELPAPLLPGTPLNLTATQLRTQDLVIYGRLAP